MILGKQHKQRYYEGKPYHFNQVQQNKRKQICNIDVQTSKIWQHSMFGFILRMSMFQQKGIKSFFFKSHKTGKGPWDWTQMTPISCLGSVSLGRQTCWWNWKRLYFFPTTAPWALWRAPSVCGGGDMCAGQSVVFPSIPMLPVTDSERADTPAEASGTWIQKTHVCRRQSKRAFMFSLGIWEPVMRNGSPKTPRPMLPQRASVGAS